MYIAITGYRHQSLTPATGHLNLELKNIFVGSLSLVQYISGQEITIKYLQLSATVESLMTRLVDDATRTGCKEHALRQPGTPGLPR